MGHVSGAPSQTPTSSPRVTRKRTPKQTIVIVAVVVALGAAVGLGSYFWASSQKKALAPSVAVISDKSIAVLPSSGYCFAVEVDQECLSVWDGAKDIVGICAGERTGTQAIRSTSSLQFCCVNPDLQSATQLGVAYVLQGSVRKSGDHLRVTAQLIASRDGTQLFSQTYDRDLSDVLKMQDEIAIALVRAFQIEVGAGIFSRPALRNTEAYTVYLQGLHAFARTNQQSIEKALRYFQRALDLDPLFADAAAKIGFAYGTLGQFGFMPPAVAYEKSRQSADLALRLDSNLAGAHALLGFIHFNYDGDWAAAERELKLARALAPNDASVLFVSSLLSGRMGRSDEALKFLNASVGRDPLFAGAQETARFHWAAPRPSTGGGGDLFSPWT